MGSARVRLKGKTNSNINRSVRKEGRKLFLSLDSRFRVVVSLNRNSDRLKLYVENKKPDSEFPMGVIGQMTIEDNVHVESNRITVLGESYPAEDFPVCNFSSYGVKPQGSCTKATVKAHNVFAGVSHTVSGVFDVPSDP